MSPIFISHKHGLVYAITCDYEYLDAKTLFSLTYQYTQKNPSLFHNWYDKTKNCIRHDLTDVSHRMAKKEKRDLGAVHI